MFLSAGGKNRRPPALASRPFIPRLQSAKRRKGSGGAVVCQKPITSRLVEMWDGAGWGGAPFQTLSLKLNAACESVRHRSGAVSHTMRTRCTDWSSQDRAVIGSGPLCPTPPSLLSAIRWLEARSRSHSLIAPLQFFSFVQLIQSSSSLSTVRPRSAAVGTFKIFC